MIQVGHFPTTYYYFLFHLFHYYYYYYYYYTVLSSSEEDLPDLYFVTYFETVISCFVSGIFCIFYSVATAAESQCGR